MINPYQMVKVEEAAGQEKNDPTGWIQDGQASDHWTKIMEENKSSF